MSKSPIKTTNLIIFDFDGTLIKGDSFFMLNLLLTPKIIDRLRLYFYMALTKINLLDNGRFKEKIIRKFWISLAANDKKNIVEKLFCQINRQLKTQVTEKLRKHIDSNDEVIILSASPDFYLNTYVQTTFPGAKIAASKVKIEGKNLKLENYYRETKTQITERLIEENDYGKIILYTDSINDLPLINLCSITYLVDPTKAQLNKIKELSNKEIIPLFQNK